MNTENNYVVFRAPGGKPVAQVALINQFAIWYNTTGEPAEIAMTTVHSPDGRELYRDLVAARIVVPSYPVPDWRSQLVFNATGLNLKPRCE